MLEILILIAVIGSLAAGVLDLRTTEVPDEIPALMIALSLFFWYVFSLSSGDFSNLFLSIAIGTILLAAGLVLYKKGQWGEADAWILAAIGYALPVVNGRLFMADFILNFLLVSVAYMVVYTLVLGIMDRRLFSHFLAELNARRRVVLAAVVLLSALALGISPLLADIYAAVPLAAVFALLALFLVYGKTIEKYAFRKKIPAARLKPGDVLEEMIWRGLTAEEVKDIRKKRKYVVVKEGVRFVMVFPLTLIVTLLYGNLFLILFV